MRVEKPEKGLEAQTIWMWTIVFLNGLGKSGAVDQRVSEQWKTDLTR